MATRARLSQDRSRQRRNQLLDAAIELFAVGGARGITHRAVAAQAGLPPATTTYYFTSIDELIDEALTRHMDTWLHDLRALTSTPIDIRLDLDVVNSFIATIFAVRSPQIVGLQLSVFLAAARNERLRPRAVAALNELESLATTLLTRIGVADAHESAESIVAVIAGSAISRLAERRSDAEEAAALSRSLQGLVAAALMNQEELATVLRRLKVTPE